MVQATAATSERHHVGSDDRAPMAAPQSAQPDGDGIAGGSPVGRVLRIDPEDLGPTRTRPVFSWGKAVIHALVAVFVIGIALALTGGAASLRAVSGPGLAAGSFAFALLASCCFQSGRKIEGWLLTSFALSPLYLGVLLGALFYRAPTARRDEALAQLELAQRNEPCDRANIVRLANALLDRSESRRGIGAATAFLQRCGQHDGLRRFMYHAHTQLGEWPQAVEQATQLLVLHPLTAEYHGWRGFAYEQSGDLERAAQDLRQSLLLEPSYVDVAFALADVYERQSKPCEAVVPLEQLLLLHGHESGSERVRARVASLADKGKCPTGVTAGGARIPVRANAPLITAKVCVSKTTCGLFAVDTGASYVSLSERFAKRLRLETDRMPSVRLRTANGVVDVRIGLLDEVSVQEATATRVPAVVSPDLGEIDGLLGLSFLSRFDFKQTATALEITERATGKATGRSVAKGH